MSALLLDAIAAPTLLEEEEELKEEEEEEEEEEVRALWARIEAVWFELEVSLGWSC